MTRPFLIDISILFVYFLLGMSLKYVKNVLGNPYYKMRRNDFRDDSEIKAIFIIFNMNDRRKGKL